MHLCDCAGGAKAYSELVAKKVWRFACGFDVAIRILGIKKPAEAGFF